MLSVTGVETLFGVAGLCPACDMSSDFLDGCLDNLKLVVLFKSVGLLDVPGVLERDCCLEKGLLGIGLSESSSPSNLFADWSFGVVGMITRAGGSEEKFTEEDCRKIGGFIAKFLPLPRL
jgi:hypothetical protein